MDLIVISRLHLRAAVEEIFTVEIDSGLID